MTAPEPAQLRARLITALSKAGAFCGECAFEPGDIGCPDCQRAHGWYADAVLGIVQPELTSREQQAANAQFDARQANQRAEEAESALEAWDELRAQAHEDMRAGFAEAIRWKWDSEMAAPDADMAADAVIDYLENEYAGHLARARQERDQLRAQLAAVRAYADDLYTAPQKISACGVRERLLGILTPPGPKVTFEEAMAGRSDAPKEDTP